MDEIFGKINSEINIKRYKQEYMSHFEVLRDTIFTALKKNQTFAALYNGNYLRGSYADNLKVKYPNEYDLVFRLKLPEEKRILVVKDEKIPGNVKLDLSQVLNVITKQKQHVNTYKQLKKMVTAECLLSIQLLQSWLESCFTKALDNMNKKIIYNGITATLSYSKQGPAHTIYVKKPYTYSVDFVPAIVLISSKAILPRISKDWDAIPKPLKWLLSDTSFRASYDNLETEMIKNKKNLKNALRIIKKFRDIHTNMHNLKSYYIKTLFLWRASREPGKFWYQPIGFVVIQYPDILVLRAGSVPDKIKPTQLISAYILYIHPPNQPPFGSSKIIYSPTQSTINLNQISNKDYIREKNLTWLLKIATNLSAADRVAQPSPYVHSASPEASPHSPTMGPWLDAYIALKRPSPPFEKKEEVPTARPDELSPIHQNAYINTSPVDCVKRITD
ncbi:cyclic GMP-AMP synthase-like receptor isoform X2 [Bactrocera oleae]|uniref:cyclic GMP-AMP synthase-like receptor isoform X2 n=1 Tax=Bactrocera oleae TaxID=104688 RepID=UPI00387E945F